LYKWNAADYQKSSSEQEKWALELFSKLSLNGDKRVLDIGCGDGGVTARIASSLPGGSVLGIDNSADMIHFAKKNHPVDKFPNLTFKLKDARDLDFESEFDLVFSNATLHWVIDHLPVLKGVQRSLKSSGKLLFQMGGKGNAREILSVLDIVIRRDRWHRYFTDFQIPYGFYVPDDYRCWLEDAGLEAKRVELIPKDMIQKGKEGLTAWIRTTWLPYTAQIPENLRNKFIADIVDKYLENHPIDDDGFIHVKMMRLEVEAVKKPRIGG